ncbi:unnamed protein product [Paramecium octaurelia]|uniref:Uncharacterized protein n=1 Tax=Paramecium octaurelia TaxID=43137 RepID=A0A8S1X9R3_PAROT|nr:unnamed protein product [Paramecium octaurelia]
MDFGKEKCGNKIGQQNTFAQDNYDIYSTKCGNSIELIEFFGFINHQFGEQKNNINLQIGFNGLGQIDEMLINCQSSGGLCRLMKIKKKKEKEPQVWKVDELCDCRLCSYVTKNKMIKKWDIVKCQYFFNLQFKGGGKQVEENKLVGSEKNGIWVELCDGFRKHSQVTVIWNKIRI